MFSGLLLLRRAAAKTTPWARSSVQVTIRGYRGDSGEAELVLSAKEEALLKIALPKADEIYKTHIELPGNDLETRRKRLIYRSKQRGWLEVDLLLGTYASRFVPKMNTDELDQFEDFVNMETIDIYNIITLRLDVPEELKMGGEGVVELIQEWARESPLGKADPEKYKTVKTDAKLI
jgi:succinate dehydrogenase assembly factor 2